MRNFVCSPAPVLAGLVLTSLLAPGAGAQQFQQVTPLPTIAGATARWSEGIECADVDHDGDLDVFLADGDGFASAGVKRQNGLIVNKLVEIGAWNFADESVLRLGARVSNAKQVTTGDVNGDGWVDALFANCFNTDTPFLYINRGNGQPGFFDMESSTRGFTFNLSSGGACFADLDDDGDLDVIINDAYFASGKPRLFFNNGSGVFAENAAALNAPNKSSQQDVQFADVDNDWDLDFVGFNRAANANGTHYLMLNDGAGNFTDVSATLGTTGGNVYEGDIGDLDGDNDIDLFLVSLSGFAEGAIRNNIVPSTSLSFTQQGLLGGTDDNEIALIDFDNDGDYDPLVGSLGASEVLYQNNGGFAFANSGAVQAQADSSLDCTVADLNNDGAYDILTAQGESGNFTDKYYRNVGPADAVAPVITGVKAPLSASPTGPTVVRAKIRDQMLDDGVNHVKGEARYVVLTAPSTQSVTIGVTGGFSPSAVNVQAGTTVTWTNTSASNQRVASTTSPFQYDSGPIAPGGTFTHVFVSTGNYGYANSIAATSGSVAVAGSVTTVAATYSGGQLYRFRMNDTAGGAGVQLCYELFFQDWPGNVRVSDSGCIPLSAGGPVGTPFCFGDGSTTTLCPCFNLGVTGRGCDNSAATGGASLSGSGTVSPDTVVLTTSGELPTVLSIFLQGDVNNSAGVVFGDGVRCVAGSLKRIGVKNAVAGSASYPQGGDPSITSQSATLGDPIAPGSTRYYQVYYRDPDLSFCPGQAFNVSSALQVTW
jgi:plastocyanin